MYQRDEASPDQPQLTIKMASNFKCKKTKRKSNLLIIPFYIRNFSNMALLINLFIIFYI